MQFVDRSLGGSAQEPIENAAALIPFFQRLAVRSPATSGEPLRILQFGDSHTAADEWTGTLRWYFQSEWGDGGAGFSYAGRPWRTYRRLDVRGAMSRNWITHGLLTRNEDGLQGLAGASISTSRAGETVTLRAVGERLEIHYLQQPDGGRLLLSDGGAAAAEFSTAGELGPGVVGLDVSPGEHVFELRTLDRAPVRLFGWVTENRGGATYETLGINGAQAEIILGWDPEMLRAYLERRAPALIVIAYGTNEAGSKLWTLETYQEMFERMLRTIREAVPTSAVLVAGPPDRGLRSRGRWLTHPGVDRIVTAQRAAAASTGCAFWDTRGRMGGKGAMDQWVRAGLAQYDRVHLTATGYQRLGHALFQDLTETFRKYVEVSPFLIGQKADGPADEDH